MENKKTLERQILAHLLRGNALTVKSCWSFFRTTELRHFIAIYRKHYAIPVRSEREKNTADNGTHNVYFISKPIIEALKTNAWVKELI